MTRNKPKEVKKIKSPQKIERKKKLSAFRELLLILKKKINGGRGA
jgi:hypothetical protein